MCRFKSFIFLCLSVCCVFVSCDKHSLDQSLRVPYPCPKPIANGAFIFDGASWTDGPCTFHIDSGYLIVNGITLSSPRADSATICFQGDTAMYVVVGGKIDNPYPFIDTSRSISGNAYDDGNNIVKAILRPFNYDKVHTIALGSLSYVVSGSFDACTFPNYDIYKLDRVSGDTTYHLQLSRTRLAIYHN